MGGVIGAAAGAVVADTDAVVGAAASAVVADPDCAGTPGFGVGVAAEAGDSGRVSNTDTSPAGGQGSPPGTRGRPRRSCSVSLTLSFTVGADTAAAGTVS
ncbi:hypothetical protein [Arthrobacter sp. H14-L1]|uniref:hypothetical protein n=1 Tax=Arthrobacter sp. H14-L1 TaxID=2996697 RepID=UPI0022702656|nr:hypothetical protein [Arthrobacter sp. H14-L1]